MNIDYVVRKGDTLSGIAERFGVSLQSLEAANPQIDDPDLIFAGEVIQIPTRGRIYVVQEGDTLTEIAKRFRISLDALVAANPQIENPDLIFPGQRLRIPPVPR